MRELLALNAISFNPEELNSQPPPVLWRTTRYHINLDRPKLMAIVNVTPDSFATHTLGQESALQLGADDLWIQKSLEHAQFQLKAGADILDIGAESTRPGAEPVPLEQEWSRLEPILKEVVHWGVPISVDTYKPEIMQRSLDLGVDIINDIWALRQPKALEVLGAYDAGICLMHMHADPQTMQVSPMQGEVLDQVSEFLSQRLNACLDQGIAQNRLILDPGVGFGKTVAQNFELLNAQALLQNQLDGMPLLVGWSRKSSLGAVTGLAVEDRMGVSVVAAILAIERGAQVVRVHDVGPTMDALKVWLHASALSENRAT